MKRDMDLVRAILLDIETNNVLHEYPYTPQIPGYCLEEIAYHVEIMEDAGLLFGNVTWDRQPVIALGRMGWKGHEFLDASRNETLWKKAKEKALAKTGGIGFETVITFLFQQATGS